MKKYILTKQGFTLLEMLVVVLIIGILASFALPQYNKAVLKSKYSTLMPVAKALQEGNESFFLTNGYYTDAVEDLDIEVPEGGNLDVVLMGRNRYKYVKVTRDDIHNNYIYYQNHSINYPGEVHCEALTGDE